MRASLVIAVCLCSFNVFTQPLRKGGMGSSYYLIAHRGGVVDSVNAENSMPALEAAVERGYQMVEMDMRVTRDRVLIINHDADFKKYYGVNRRVTDMTWAEISQLQNKTNGSRVARLEDVFRYCKGKIAVMLDNKIDGNDSALFAQVLNLLDKYGLLSDALMIGTDESTPYFTGKIRLSCSRQQLEDNIRKPGFRPQNYYLFGNDITAADVAFAKKNGILAVGVVNAWRYHKAADPAKAAADEAARLQAIGLDHFQIDSEFDHYFYGDKK